MEQVVIKEVSDRLVQFRYKQMGGKVGSRMRKKQRDWKELDTLVE